MRKLTLGLFGALAALGAVAAAPPPAAAQVSVTIGTPGYYPPPAYRPYRPAYVAPSPVYRPYPRWRRAYYAPSCVVRIHRYWDGYGWVRERRRVCS